ncbi:MAG: hypothetical protein O7H41_15230 [Planctomycetota bacterium]|nr:hypothetical protein [Planctomycetota bacterium]
MITHRGSLLFSGLVSGLAFVVLLAVVAPLLVAQEEEGITPEELFATAKAAYGEKKYGTAVSELNLLVSLINKIRVDVVQAALPAAPAGWTAKNPSSDNVGMLAAFGGGFSVSRRYKKEGTDSQVTLVVMADSPLVSMFSAMLKNPMLLQAQGATLIKLGNQRAILEYEEDNNSGEVKFLINANTAVVTVKGKQIEKSVLLGSFAKAIDIAALEKAIQD